MEEYNHLPDIIDALRQWGVELTESTAKEIVAAAQDQAPDSTGFLKSTIYYSANGVSTYGEGFAAPPNGATILEAEKPSEGAIVGVAASYGEFQEYGTSHDAAHPYLTPAADAAWSKFASGDGLEETLAQVK